MRPLPARGFIQRNPHSRIHGVIAPSNTDVVPSMLLGQLGCLIILDGDSPYILLALGIHDYSVFP
jgi:hypothetical protein